MINQLHYLVHRPEKGWDPVPSDWAKSYTEQQWRDVNIPFVEGLVSTIGGVEGKSVLDLGAGPGHYAAALAVRGANVTWYDVSRVYSAIAEERALRIGARMRYVVGYLDDAIRNLGQQFDFVFNRGCWNYALDDRRFARVVFDLVKPGGAAYVDLVTSDFVSASMSRSLRMRTRLNDLVGYKIGHPFTRHGLVARELAAMPISRMQVDYADPHADRIYFWK